MVEKIDIKELSYKELEKIITEQGFPSYRTGQIFHWVYQKKVSSFSEMSNIPHNFITRLRSLFQLNSLQCIKKMESRDGRLCENSSFTCINTPNMV